MSKFEVWVRRPLKITLACAVLALPTIALAEDEGGPEWQAIVDKAKQEGTVTIYSGGGQKQLDDLAERFEAKYGIKVQAVRAVETDFFPRLEVEKEQNAGIADVAVAASLPTVHDYEQRGFMQEPVGPAFDAAEYDRATRMPSNSFFELSAAVLTYSWNTNLVPEGIDSYADIVNNPTLADGMIAVPVGRGASRADFYTYLEKNYGADYVEKLAALKPRSYPGALPMAQAVVSGEVAAAIYGEPMIDEKEKGAPVDWGLAPNPWGARFYGMILASAPHPNAAQVLANFMVTREGQEAISRKAASVLPDVEGAVAETKDIPEQD
ncbi:MAG: extracellular solute-binding protein, partial [Hyphomicrobiaceae bacterium]